MQISYVHVYTCIHIHTYIYTCAGNLGMKISSTKGRHTYIHTYIHTYSATYIHIVWEGKVWVVCTYLCVCVKSMCVRVCIYVCMYVWSRIILMREHGQLYIYANVYMYICVCVYMYLYIHIYVNVYIPILCVCIYICRYM